MNTIICIFQKLVRPCIVSKNSPSSFTTSCILLLALIRNRSPTSRLAGIAMTTTLAPVPPARSSCQSDHPPHRTSQTLYFLLSLFPLTLLNPDPALIFSLLTLDRLLPPTLSPTYTHLSLPRPRSFSHPHPTSVHSHPHCLSNQGRRQGGLISSNKPPF